MKLSEDLLEEYTKKILGFAYEKTGNSYEAEELTQEIMLQLLDCKITYSQPIDTRSEMAWCFLCFLLFLKGSLEYNGITFSRR